MNFTWYIDMIKQSATSHKMISSYKWRRLMQSCLTQLRHCQFYDRNLIDDLSCMVSAIPQEMFVQAALNNKTRKQHRMDQLKTKTDKNIKRLSESTCRSNHCSIGSEQALYDEQLKSSITNLLPKQFRTNVNQRVFQRVQQIMTLITKERHLPRQFRAKHHPYRRLLKEFLFIIESKYSRNCAGKNYIKMEELQQNLMKDVQCFQKFISLSSQPYFNIYQSQDLDQINFFKKKMIDFIKDYIIKHEKVNESIHKIMQMASRKSVLILHLQLSLPYFIEASEFKMQDHFVIQGHYLLTLNSLIEFTKQKTSIGSLDKLRQVRQLIITDIDNYYTNHPKAQNPSTRRMNTECQLEILKYLLCKLKTFLPEIYAQIKYLEVILGEKQLSFLYDDSSYMYAQLLVALDSLQIDYP